MEKLLNNTILLVSLLASPMLVNTASAGAPAGKPHEVLNRLWKPHSYESHRSSYGIFHSRFTQPHAQREWKLGRLTLRLPMLSTKGIVKRLNKGKAVRLSLRKHELTAGFREIMSHSTKQVGPAATVTSIAGMLSWTRQAEAFLEGNKGGAKRADGARE